MQDTAFAFTHTGANTVLPHGSEIEVSLGFDFGCRSMSCDRIKQLSHQTYGRRILTVFEKTNEHDRIEMDTTNHFD